MPLYQVTPQQLPQVWPVVAPMLQRAVDLEPEQITIEQTEYLIRTGQTYLLIWEEPNEGITGAATVDIIDYPRQRAAHVNLMGGKGIVRPHVFEEAKNWMRLMGATVAQCWAKGSLVTMYEKMGMTSTHQVMREKL
jgi:hypothetical protein